MATAYKTTEGITKNSYIQILLFYVFGSFLSYKGHKSGGKIHWFHGEKKIQEGRVNGIKWGVIIKKKVEGKKQTPSVKLTRDLPKQTQPMATCSKLYRT